MTSHALQVVLGAQVGCPASPPSCRPSLPRRSAGWRKWLPAASTSTDSDLPRAQLLSWLLESSKLDHLFAVNASLDQPLHCCVKSGSWHVLKVSEIPLG